MAPPIILDLYWSKSAEPIILDMELLTAFFSVWSVTIFRGSLFDLWSQRFSFIVLSTAVSILLLPIIIHNTNMADASSSRCSSGFLLVFLCLWIINSCQFKRGGEPNGTFLKIYKLTQAKLTFSCWVILPKNMVCLSKSLFGELSKGFFSLVFLIYALQYFLYILAKGFFFALLL